MLIVPAKIAELKKDVDMTIFALLQSEEIESKEKEQIEQNMIEVSRLEQKLEKTITAAHEATRASDRFKVERDQAVR